MTNIEDSLDLVRLVQLYSGAIDNGRNPRDVLKHLKSEVHELSGEVYFSHPSDDGIVGEAVDVILCALDIICLERKYSSPSALTEEIEEIARKKCKKWKDKAISGASKEIKPQKLAMNLRMAANDFNDALTEINKTDMVALYDVRTDKTIYVKRIYRSSVEEF